MDLIEKHKLVTRTMALAITYVCLTLAAAPKPDAVLVEYAFWALAFMFAALLFGDKMLFEIKGIIKAWRGKSDV